MKWFMLALRRYAQFAGRSQRAEYWYFVLFYMVIYVVLRIIDGSIGAFGSQRSIGVLTAIFVLATFIPSWAVCVRRLHDTNRSGWWILISLVPFVGWIVLLIFTVQDGTPGDNRFGADPKRDGYVDVQLT